MISTNDGIAIQIFIYTKVNSMFKIHFAKEVMVDKKYFHENQNKTFAYIDPIQTIISMPRLPPIRSHRRHRLDQTGLTIRHELPIVVGAYPPGKEGNQSLDGLSAFVDRYGGTYRGSKAAEAGSGGVD